jgi:HAMP domain-containing protein
MVSKSKSKAVKIDEVAVPAVYRAPCRRDSRQEEVEEVKQRVKRIMRNLRRQDKKTF